MTFALGSIRSAYSDARSGILHSMSLLERRLVVVTGKGGVGKTTVSAALGLLAARAGKRTVICEVAEQEQLAAIFGVAASEHEERELRPRLHAISVDPERAKEEWLRYQLKSSALASVLGGSSVFRCLSAAAPGLSELVTIGKVWDLAQLERRTGGSEFDLTIVDAPATGHGVAMLRPVDLRQRGACRSDPPAGAHHRPVLARPAPDRRGGRGAAGGDAGK